MKKDKIAQAYLKNGRKDLYGTYMHNRVFKRIKPLNIDGLIIDKSIKKPGTLGGKGNIGRPDFQWKPGSEDYDIWDLKPNGYNWPMTGQYQDILDWTNIIPTQFNYNK